MRDCKKFCWKKSSNITPPSVDYSKQYLTFEALEDTMFAFSTNALQYSLDDGITWATLAADTATPTVTAGNKILWKQTGLTPSEESSIGTFSATGNFNAYGNIMSLYYGDNFVGQTDLTGKDLAFAYLFSGNNKLISTENLILPATTLAGGCYGAMFTECTSLTTAPKILPATTLSGVCYGAMFMGCTSLTTTPELPATTLAEGCYQMMFTACTSLTTTPDLPATILAEHCYEGMFGNCTSLTTAPEILPATTLANSCYDQMFWGCTSLITAPELPATTLAESCYRMMFYGCTSLTTAPELPATTLVESCYILMFAACTSLATAPELPATTLVEDCYNSMFFNCTSLNYIKCLATDISANGCTNSWVDNVAATGTFVKDTSMESWTTGNNGIPSGWTVENEGRDEAEEDTHDYSQEYLTFEALEDGTFKFSNNALQYSLDNGTTWETLAANSETPLISAGSKILWKQTGLTPDLNGIGRFSSTGEYNAYGNVMSLYYGDDFENQTDLTGKDDAFKDLFYENINLVDVSNLVLPATTLADNCYASMFDNCTSLTSAPVLSATTLAMACYGGMFYGCTSLTTAPELPATTLVEDCYSGMFWDCTSLTSAPELPATTLASNCYESMFNGCTSLTTAPELPATTLAENCYSNMFYGCTSLTTAPVLPATTLAEYCYDSMFIDCSSLSYVDIYANEDIIYLVYNNNANSVYGKLVLHGDSPLASQDLFLQQFGGWEMWIDDEFEQTIELQVPET